MEPFNIARLPVSVSGFERLNDRPVVFEQEIKIRNDVYQLRSVVLAEINKNAPERNIVVGSSALLMKHANHAKGEYESSYIVYDPVGVTDVFLAADGKHQTNAPIYEIPFISTVGPGFQTMASERGIIFLYQLTKDETKDEVSY